MIRNIKILLFNYYILSFSITQYRHVSFYYINKKQQSKKINQNNRISPIEKCNLCRSNLDFKTA